MRLQMKCYRVLFFTSMLTKRCIVFFSIILITLPAIAQQVIQGAVIDSTTNLPLEGATVTLLPSNISSVTNAGGNFIFKKNISSDNSVVISEIGYADKTFTLD